MWPEWAVARPTKNTTTLFDILCRSLYPSVDLTRVDDAMYTKRLPVLVGQLCYKFFDDKL